MVSKLFEKLFHKAEIESLKSQIACLKRQHDTVWKLIEYKEEKEKILDTIDSDSTTSYNGLSSYPRYIFNLNKDGSLVIKHQHIDETSTTCTIKRKDVSLLLTLLEYYKDIIEKK